MPSREDYIRLAALIDCEGSIYIRADRIDRRTNTPVFTSLQMEVVNVDPRMALWCKEVFGGSCRVHRTNEKLKGHRPVVRWMVSCQKAEDIIRECMPFFLVKREQGEIALAYRATFRGRRTRAKSDGLTQAEILERHRCRAELSRLKDELPDAAKALVQ